MPEYAEVRLMSDFINEVSKHNELAKSIYAIRPNKRVISDFSNIKYPFSYISTTKGKELKLEILDSNHKLHIITFTMGMSGTWQLFKSSQKISNSVRLVIELPGYNLCLLDTRRFAVWKWRDFNESRGPDPVQDFDNFKNNVIKNLNKKIFQKPIFEILLNQTYFNGVGNYLRSTVLYRLNRNPFVSAQQYIQEVPEIFEEVRNCCLFAYQKQGAQLRDWKNPNPNPNIEKSQQEFLDWVFYQKGKSFVDSNGRNFWYHPQWENEKNKMINKSNGY
jgi:endonuclease VIII-like 1